MSNLYILVGLPASGKSTYAKNNIKAHILSSDEYREKLFNDVNDQKHNDEVFKTLYADMISYLKNEEDVCIDATNLNRKTRSKIFNLLASNKIKCNVECILFATGINTVIERNRNRDRVVPESVIKRMILNFEIPFLGEGFSNIKIIDTPDTNLESINDIKEKMVGFNQENPHHSFTLDEHCEKCFNLVSLSNTKNEELKFASRIHDIGKLFTKEYDKEKNLCHYLGHENFGSYLILTNNNLDNKNILSIDFRYSVAFYINYHMESYRLQKAKDNKIQKYANQFGDYWDDLCLLHEADVNAH